MAQDLPENGLTLDRLVRITIGGDLAIDTGGSAGPAPSPPSSPDQELREDGGFELREDGGYELRD